MSDSFLSLGRRQSEPGLSNWLRRKGLHGNPFQEWSAEHDRDLPSYFVDLGAFDDILYSRAPCVVFARRGCGKTAHRRMLAACCWPLTRHHPPRLAIRFAFDSFDQVWKAGGAGSTPLSTARYVAELLRQVLSTLFVGAREERQLRKKLESRPIARQVTALRERYGELTSGSAGDSTPVLETPADPEVLEELAALIEGVGFSQCVVLVDEVDDLMQTADEPAQQVALLAPLLGTPSLIKQPDMAFKFFLPQRLRPLLESQQWFECSKPEVFGVGWGADDLQELISQRLLAFGGDKSQVYTLGQLCEVELARTIDQEIALLARGRPRRAINLADRLLRAHCQQDSPPPSSPKQPGPLSGLPGWKSWRTRPFTTLVDSGEIPPIITASIERVVPMPNQSLSIGRRQSDSSLDNWLRRRDLSGNPFQEWGAEYDRDLPGYFVDLGTFDEILDSRAPCVVFARRGCGKTAHRRMLAENCRPLDPGSPRLAVVYGYEGFEQVMDSVAGDVEGIRPIHHVQALLNRGLTALMDAAERDSEVSGRQADPDVTRRLADYVARFAPHLAERAPDGDPDALAHAGSLELLEGFARLVSEGGLASCVFLVDGVDEFDRTAGSPERTIAFLKPLLATLPLVECPGLAFRFFLPQEMETALCEQAWFRGDRLHIVRIAWGEEHLRRLIRQRLAYFSRRNPAYSGLGELCGYELLSPRDIDAELVSLADGSPREALILASALLETHCQQPDPPELIEMETWEQVRGSWREKRAGLVEGSYTDAQPDALPVTASVAPAGCGDFPPLRVDEDKGLVWLGDRDVTARVGYQEYRLLQCLYRRRGNVCSKQWLAEQAWAGLDGEPEEAAGIADQAIAASIKRLRRALGQNTPDEGYVETVRGRGYRLHPDGF